MAFLYNLFFYFTFMSFIVFIITIFISMTYYFFIAMSGGENLGKQIIDRLIFKGKNRKSADSKLQLLESTPKGLQIVEKVNRVSLYFMCSCMLLVLIFGLIRDFGKG